MANTDKNSASEPDVEQKRAAYAALADVLANDLPARSSLTSCKAAATPPPDSTPTLTPPAVKEETTVLENVTHQISREYGEQLSSRFSQLWRNITGSPHKPLIRNLYQRGLAFFTAGRAGVCLLVAGTLPRRCRCIAKMGEWGRHKTAIAVTGSSCSDHRRGVYHRPAALLALTLFVGQLLLIAWNGNNPTIAFSRVFSPNAPALIEFFESYSAAHFLLRAFRPAVF